MTELNSEDTKTLQIALKQALGFVLDRGEQLVQQAEKTSPEDAATNMLVPLMQSIHASAAEAGHEIKMEILLAAAVHVIRAIAELFIMAGVIQESDAKSFASKLTQKAIAQHNGGR